MPRKSKNDKRPHELTLELFSKQATLTPTEIDNHVGNGPYAAKHVWFLRKLGHDISVVKNGRSVVSYTYNRGPTSTTRSAAVEVGESKPTKKSVDKTPKETKKKVSKKKEVEEDATKNMPSFQTKDEVEKTFGSSGAVTSYTVDPDWDAVTDVRELF